MSVPESLNKLVGNWTGTSRLYRPWLPPETSESVSESTASVALAARGKFAAVEYTWAVDGEPQEGFLLLGCENGDDQVTSVWIDSWHMSDKSLACVGKADASGAVSVLGSYSAPPGPDWGWRTVISPEPDGSFAIIMYNISPEGEEMLAFENRYEPAR
ncbi:MAG TPA: DUF1579 family protein [Blastocatellia bacterium]|nr:DUF1579 family protein [Blastocatellia bacterium]